MNELIAFVSLGCAKNQVNCEQMMYLLSDAGYGVVFAEDPEIINADVVIINTCGFIESAKSEAIDAILSYAEAKADGRVGKVIATGCLTQRYSDEIMEEIPELDGAVGVGSYGDIVEIVEKVLADDRASSFGDIDAPDLESGRVLSPQPSWAYLKIAEGCDNRCAYCVIPDIRGRFRSRPIENVVAEAKGLAEQGIEELIVVAQDITRYGLDLYGRRSLDRLLKELCAIDGFRWIRLHYLYPDEIDDELIDVIAGEEKILKYLDIPIQHINDNILRLMHRRGTGGEIRALFKKLRDRIPGLVLRTSLITGLPGEGEAEFEELCDFLREAKI
ncbi:MAG: 30S ribosomal protein S12 methylthiotransferase RimO, partial [Oscillospiraceae bacterium]|nr:30S ribosomal protein S12 methylthiotransferase RimO [Oscillospiraceae bacterium]